MPKIKLYRHPLFGYSHRVELLASILGLNVELIDIDLIKVEQKSPEFLAKKTHGRIAVLVDSEVILYDSNAILIYLENKNDRDIRYYTNDPIAAAKIQRYLSAAAGSMVNGTGAERLINVFRASLNLEQAISTAHLILNRFEADLNKKRWLAGNHITVADIANYAYIEHSSEGNIELSHYPNIRTWIKRIRTLGNFIPMIATPAGLAA